MRKLLTILFLFLSLTALGQNHYYVAMNGIDAEGRGTLSYPWKTLSYAIPRVTTAGSVIHVEAGTYPAITTQMSLANGVSIEGAGRNFTTIPLTYSGGTPCIKLETWLGWENKATVGHQHISGIKFVGSTTPGTPIGIMAIKVNFRNYVEIHDCWFEDFRDIAVQFTGEPTYNNWTIDNPYETRTGNEDSHYLPFNDSFCVGNKFYNNVVHNSCRVLDQTTHDSSGELEVATQDGMLIYGNNMTALGRTGHDNGVPIKMIGDCGFNRNVKIYNNTINAGHKSTNYWQFAIEAWWNLGGIEIYNNTLNGSIDLCDSWDLYGVGFATKIYDNDIGYPTVTNEYDTGIIIEGTHIGDSIFRNKIHNVGKGIGINRTLYSTTTQHNGLYIYDNLFVELSGNAFQTWGIYMDYNGVSNNSVVWKNWYIQHNVFVARADAPTPTYYGIVLPTVEIFENLFIENNIFINWERGAIWGSGTRTIQTNFNIRNNLIYESYNNNDPVYVNGYPTKGIIYSGTVRADPLFLSVNDYRVQASSPCVSAGRYLGYTWLNTDYAGNDWMNPPTIGAYEMVGSGMPIVLTAPVTDITATTAVSGGKITSDGGEPITARGVCWSTSTPPTVAGDKTTNGTGTGPFTSKATGLTYGETYYLRAYATNSIGTAYGLEYVFKTSFPVSVGVQFIEHGEILIIHDGHFLKP